jgi:hypothetical protein
VAVAVQAVAEELDELTTRVMRKLRIPAEHQGRLDLATFRVVVGDLLERGVIEPGPGAFE